MVSRYGEMNKINQWNVIGENFGIVEIMNVKRRSSICLCKPQTYSLLPKMDDL